MGSENVEENKVFLSALRKFERGGKVVHKPISGIFDLWKSLGLMSRLQGNPQKPRAKWRGLAEGFLWPPEDHETTEETGHSAPGRLLMIAEHLLCRAEKHSLEISSVAEAVRGAVLATSALELLGPKTPTTARDALELKHRFEVKAETQFGGVQFNLDLNERFKEISRDLGMLAGWYGRKSRETSMLNGELSIVSRLMTIFRDANELEEEERCLIRIRDLQLKIWFSPRRKRNPISWIVWIFRRYIDFLLASMNRFVAAIIIWVLGMQAGFEYLQEEAEGQMPGEAELHAFGTAFSAFFGAEGMPTNHLLWIALTCVGVMVGMIHLGVFISYLYSFVSRK